MTIIFGLGASIFFSTGQKIELIAVDDIDVVEKAVIDPEQTRVIGKLQRGERVSVLSCIDLKHYIAPEIRLTDGRRGYVLVGEFRLKRTPPWSSLDSPIVFGC